MKAHKRRRTQTVKQCTVHTATWKLIQIGVIAILYPNQHNKNKTKKQQGFLQQHGGVKETSEVYLSPNKDQPSRGS